jgi:hypothetical protein
MASKKKQAEPTQEPPVRKRQDPADREPREGLKDERSLAEAEDAGAEDNGSDESQERNEAVDAELDDEEESLGSGRSVTAASRTRSSRRSGSARCTRRPARMITAGT